MTKPPSDPCPEVGQRRPDAEDLIAAVEEAMATRPTAYRDDSPLPAVGSTPPVAQPGRPPMSQGATDASVLMIAGAGSVSMVSLSAGVLMYLSQYADPVVCGLVFGAPTALVLALARLAKRARPEPEVHHHYEGPVVQDHREVTNNAKLWGKNVTDNH